MKKIIIITLFLLTFCFSIFAQENKEFSNETANAIESRSDDEGIVSGSLPQYVIYKKNYEFLTNLDRPKLTLVFDLNVRIDVEKSENLVEILDSHWKEAIKFFHKSEIEKFPNTLVESVITSAWEETNKSDIDKIRLVSINAPTGKRNISQNEASKIIEFLNTVAKSLVVKAKEFKGTYTGLKMKKKPQPSASGCNYKKNNIGRVSLRVTFDKSAKVTNVEVLSLSGCKSFNKSSIKAAKRIKFKPFMINGTPVTVKRIIMYSYSIY